MVRNRLWCADIGITDEAYAGGGEPGVTAASGDSAAPPSAPTPDCRRSVVRDRDAIYGVEFSRQAEALGIEQVVTAPRSPWQNQYAERVIGSIRRECVDCVIVLGERHLKRVLHEYVHYYNQARTHMALEKDAPCCRPVHLAERGRAHELDHLGGLHHEYVRMAA